MLKRYVILLALVVSYATHAQNTFYFTEEEALYTEGLELLDKDNYAAAREKFESYLDLTQEGARAADAEYYVAFCALSLYHRDGEKRVEAFIREHPDHPKAAVAYYELGNFYFRDKNYTKAIEYYSKVKLSLIAADQRDETRFKLAYSYFSKRRFPEALEFFNVLKRQNNEYTAASNYYAGYIESENGEYDKAIADLKRAESDASYKSVVPGMLADLYYKQKRYDELLAYSDNVLNSGARVNQNDFYLLAAEAHTQQGNYAKALTFYDRYAQDINKPSPEVYYRIGYAHYKAGNLSDAASNLKQAASNTDSIGIYASYYLGIIYLKQGNKLYAITAFDNARRSNISKELSEEGGYQYTKVSYDLGRSEETIEAANEFLEKYPDSKHTEEVSDLLSDAYLNSNNYNLAIKHIESQGQVNKKQQEVYQKATFLKGMELFNKGDYRKSIENFRKSLRYPLDVSFKAMANLWIGEAYSVGRKYEQSLEFYQTALGSGLPANNETILKARYGLGYAYYNTKEYNKALIHFKEYVSQLDAKDGYYDDALLRLADCYYVAKQYNESLTYYRRAIQANSTDNDYAHLQAGIVYGIEGSVQPAIDEFDYVINNYPKSRYLDDALFEKAQLNFEKGNYSEAVSNFSSLINKKSSSQFVPYAYMRRASSYYNLKQYDKSAADYIKVLKEFPTHSMAGEALLPLQEVLNLQNKAGEFDKYLSAYKGSNPEKKGLENVEFETAKNQYFNLNYEKAIGSFTDYIRSYPQSSNASEAKYYIAESYYRLNKLDDALETYNQLLSDGSFSPVSKLLNRLGELEFRSGRYENANYFHYQLVDAARTKKEQYYAWSGLMESYYLLGNYDSVKHYANVILEKGNVNISSQNKASLYLGKAAYASGNYEVAKDEFLNTLNTAKDEFGAEAQYLLGQIFFTKGEYQKSIEALIELNNSFNVYKEWVGKSYLLLADNYIALDDTFQAKGTLRSIIEKFPLEHIKKQAEKKLREIEKAEGTQEGSESDTLIFDN